jgi:GTPase SAR1 family protein
MVYSINNKETFENIDIWLKELRLHSSPDVKVFLIGNKVDLESERVINRADGEKYSNDNKLNLFCETSAKTGFNAQKIFIEASKLLYEDYLKYKDNDDKRNDNYNLEWNNKNSQDKNNKKRKKCC